MKHVKFGNILDVQEGIIVHGCNAQGVMGSGIAVQIKQRWPHVYETYAKFVADTRAKGRSPLGLVVPVEAQPGLYIANAITQEHYGRDPTKRYVSYEAVKKCFDVVAMMAGMDGLTVHFPLIGAGLGNGDWAIISDIIDSAFFGQADVQRTLWIYEK